MSWLPRNVSVLVLKSRWPNNQVIQQLRLGSIPLGFVSYPSWAHEQQLFSIVWWSIAICGNKKRFVIVSNILHSLKWRMRADCGKQLVCPRELRLGRASAVSRPLWLVTSAHRCSFRSTIGRGIWWSVWGLRAHDQKHVHSKSLLEL